MLYFSIYNSTHLMTYKLLNAHFEVMSQYFIFNPSIKYLHSRLILNILEKMNVYNLTSLSSMDLIDLILILYNTLFT